MRWLRQSRGGACGRLSMRCSRRMWPRLCGCVTAKIWKLRTLRGCSAGRRCASESRCSERGSSFCERSEIWKRRRLPFDLVPKERVLMLQPDESAHSQRPHDHAMLAEGLRRTRQAGIVAPPQGLFSGTTLPRTAQSPRSPWIFRAAFALPAAAAIAIGFFFAFRERDPVSASRALSQSLSVLPMTGSSVADFVLAPVRHEARNFVQETRRATESFQRAFPRAN